MLILKGKFSPEFHDLEIGVYPVILFYFRSLGVQKVVKNLEK